jgi:hypothetical protein
LITSKAYFRPRIKLNANFNKLIWAMLATKSWNLQRENLLSCDLSSAFLPTANCKLPPADGLQVPAITP